MITKYSEFTQSPLQRERKSTPHTGMKKTQTGGKYLKSLRFKIEKHTFYWKPSFTSLAFVCPHKEYLLQPPRHRPAWSKPIRVLQHSSVIHQKHSKNIQKWQQPNSHTTYGFPLQWRSFADPLRSHRYHLMLPWCILPLGYLSLTRRRREMTILFYPIWESSRSMNVKQW